MDDYIGMIRNIIDGETELNSDNKENSFECAMGALESAIEHLESAKVIIEWGGI